LHAIKRTADHPTGAGTWLDSGDGRRQLNDLAPDAAGISGVISRQLPRSATARSFRSCPYRNPPHDQSVIDGPPPTSGASPTINAGNRPPAPPTAARDRHRQERPARPAVARRAIGQARECVIGPMFGRRRARRRARIRCRMRLIWSKSAACTNPRLKVMICVPRMPDFAETKANWVRAALAQRKQAIETLTTQDRQRVAAFHPIGFPGRPSVVRSTVVIVDDVYALVGTSHFRRRGMTFDGGCDIASIDRTLNARGTSSSIARFRQELIS
jgi:hypothetical protein